MKRPSKSVQASPADTLIAAKSVIRPAHPLSPACQAELAKVCAYNDGTPWGKRVSADAAIVMCRKMGWTGTSRNALDTVCRASLGRKSYGVA